MRIFHIANSKLEYVQNTRLFFVLRFLVQILKYFYKILFLQTNYSENIACNFINASEIKRA